MHEHKKEAKASESVWPGLDAASNMDSYGFDLGCEESFAQLLHSNEVLTDAAWAEFLRSSKVESASLNEILPFIWHHGCPLTQRGAVWMCLSGAAELRANGCGSGGYSVLAARAGQTLPYRTLHQIELDLPRTFANHADFHHAAVENEALGLDKDSEEDMRSTGGTIHERNAMQCLRRILRCVAAVCAPVGYTQGMNFVAGFALLVMRGGVHASGQQQQQQFAKQHEEDAFWFSLALFTRVLPGFYAEDMPTVRVACDVLQQQLQVTLPGVEAVMSDSGLPVAALAPRWLLCLWLNACPSPVAAHLWDFMLLSHAAGAAQEQAGAKWQQTPLDKVPLAQGRSCAGLRCLIGTIIGMLRLHQCDIMQSTCEGRGLDFTIAALGTLQNVGAKCTDALPVLQYAFSGACHVPAGTVQAAWAVHRAATLEAGRQGSSLPLAAQVSWLEPTTATARLAKTPAGKATSTCAATPEGRAPPPTPPFSPLRSPSLKLPARSAAGHAPQGTTPLARVAMLAWTPGAAKSPPLKPLAQGGATPPVLLPALVHSPLQHGSHAATPQSPALALFGTPQSVQAPFERCATDGNRTPLRSPAPPIRRSRQHVGEPVLMQATPLTCAHTPGHRHPLVSPAAALEDMLLGVAERLGVPHDAALRFAGPFGFGALCPTQLQVSNCDDASVLDAFRLHPAPTASPAAPAPGVKAQESPQERRPAQASGMRVLTPPALEADDRSYIAVASALAHMAGSPAQARESAAAQAQLAARRKPLQAINRMFSPTRNDKHRGASSGGAEACAAEGILLSPVRKPTVRR